MSDHTPQFAGDDDLSVEELEQVAGGGGELIDDGTEKPNTNCGTNCHCGS